MTHAVSFRKSAQKALLRLAPEYRDATVKAIAALAENPRPDGCKKLQGEYADHYRIKVRHQISLIYQIDDAVLTVLVVTIEKRGDAY